VNYYEYNFGGNEENGYPTYIYEFKIPRYLFGVNNPDCDDQIGIQWLEGCRNDGNDATGVAYLIGTVNNCDPPLPVTLSSFKASEINGEVELNWVTESEIENQGFIIERRQKDEPWQELASFLTHTALRGQGTVTFSTEYNYIDKLVYRGNSYEYRLGDVDYDGVITYHATELIRIESLDKTGSPDLFTVKPAYPNPFNPSTLIEYRLPEDGYVTVEIYDILGYKINSLVNENKTAGWNTINWNGTNDKGTFVPAGMYLGVINSKTSRETIKLMYVK